MKGEINRDWYCNQGHSDWYRQSYCTDRCNWFDCPACHRKYPTPEQFKEEYGKAYDEDGVVWCKHINASKWYHCALDFAEAKGGDDDYVIVCACTPFGRPPDDWRPE